MGILTDEVHLRFTKGNYLGYEQFKRVLKLILELIEEEDLKVKEFKLVTVE